MPLCAKRGLRFCGVRFRLVSKLKDAARMLSTPKAAVDASPAFRTAMLVSKFIQIKCLDKIRLHDVT